MKRLIAAVWFVSSTWLVLFSTGFHAAAQTPPTPPMPGGGIIVGGGFGHGFADDAPDPGDGSDTNGTGAPGYSVPTFTTNDLWLDIAAVTNAEATLTIHYPATNADGIFDLYFTTNLDTNAAPELGMTNWEWLTQLAPGQTNITLTDLTNGPYFFVLTSTNFDQNSNSIPDAWEWQYLGGLYASNTLDFSGSGNTILYDYQNGIDPNIIQFLINTTNAYVNQTNAPLSLAIQGGIPFAYAVSLNTNFSAATWQTYTSSNITASLGTNQGPLTVWVGCRGLPAGTQTWNAICLTLDLTPPSITVTNPATNTLNIPLLQWQGYASEQLSSLTWGLSNALGSISNQPGYITGHSGNTNYFKCFDIGLGMGVNTLTLHAVDLAGNATNVSCNYTLVSNTVAPALQIWWPQNGTQVGAGSFTLRGYIPDPTVSLAAQIVDTNNNTNLAVGVIERNGDFWVDNIPLMPGSNSLTLTAVDVWGNTNTTNLIVVQSPVQVTINPVTVARNAASLTVEGTINTSNYEIWVNGVEATVSGGTNWTASNVPANGAGMGVFQACAVTNGGGGSGGGGGTNSSLDDPGNPSSTNSIYAEADIGKQPALICESFNFSSTIISGDLESDGSEILTYIQTVNWSAQTGGTMTSNNCSTVCSIYNDPECFSYYEASQCQWDTNGNGTYEYGYSFDCGVITNWSAPGIYTGATNFGILEGTATTWEATGGSVDLFVQGNLSANTRYHFLTGDRAVPGLTPLYQFTASANNVYPQFYPVQYVSVAPQNIDVLGGPLDSSGELFTNLPNGEEVDATPIAASAPYYSAGLSFTNYALNHQCVGATSILDPSRLTLGVGEEVKLSFTPTLANNAIWTTTAGGLVLTNGLTNFFTAPSNSGTATITVRTSNGFTLGRLSYQVSAPIYIDHIDLRSNEFYPAGKVGCGMVLTPYFSPMTVSFYRVQVMEVGAGITPLNVTGYFATLDPTNLEHYLNGANVWFNIEQDNSWQHLNTNADQWDYADIGPFNPPGYGGGYNWIIPDQWKVGTNGTPSPNEHGWDQFFSLDAAGNMTIQKLGWKSTRDTNGGYTTTNTLHY